MPIPVQPGTHPLSQRVVLWIDKARACADCRAQIHERSITAHPIDLPLDTRPRLEEAGVLEQPRAPVIQGFENRGFFLVRMQRSEIRGQWSFNRSIPEAALRALSGLRLLTL